METFPDKELRNTLVLTTASSTIPKNARKKHKHDFPFILSNAAATASSIKEAMLSARYGDAVYFWLKAHKWKKLYGATFIIHQKTFIMERIMNCRKIRFKITTGWAYLDKSSKIIHIVCRVFEKKEVFCVGARTNRKWKSFNLKVITIIPSKYYNPF